MEIIIAYYACFDQFQVTLQIRLGKSGTRETGDCMQSYLTSLKDPLSRLSILPRIYCETQPGHFYLIDEGTGTRLP